MQTWVFPRGEQRLHALGNVRHRRECIADHIQPRQQIRGAGQPLPEGGDEARGRAGDPVAPLELALRGRPALERRLLPPVRRRRRLQLRQSLQPQCKTLLPRRIHHPHRRRPQLPKRLPLLDILIINCR